MRWLICGSDKHRVTERLMDEVLDIFFIYDVFMRFCVCFLCTRSTECVLICSSSLAFYLHA